MKYSVAFLCHLLPKRRCNLMQGQQRVALQWHQQAIAHPQATRCLHTSFEKICEASRMVNPNIFAKPTGHQNPINTNIIFRNLCGKLLMIDFVKMAKTPTPRHQGAQIQGTTEDRAPTPNSIIIVVQRSRKHQDKSTSLDKIWCEKPPHQTKISFPEKPTKNIPIKKGCLLDNDPFLIYKIVLVLFFGGGPKKSFIFSIGDELDPRHGTARRWRLQSRWKVLQGRKHRLDFCDWVTNPHQNFQRYLFSRNHGNGNYPKWKEIDIGDTPIFLWTMIVGGKVSVFGGFWSNKG